jgi:hypothetical protein
MALQLVEKGRGMRSRQVRMVALGAIDNESAVMQEWSRIVRGRGVIELSCGDWFFLPATLWESPEFWENLLRVNARIINLGLHSPNSEILGPPELFDRPLEKPWKQIHRYAIEFHLARTRADKVMLRRLCRKFPKWDDCRLALQQLHETGKAPTRDDLLLAFTREPKSARRKGKKGDSHQI